MAGSALGVPLSAPRSAHGATTVTAIASHDAYVASDAPTSNTGTANNLRIRQSGSKQLHTYLRFDVSGVGTATAATLRLWVIDPSVDGGSVHSVADTSWSESSLTWANRPSPVGPTLDRAGAVSSGAWVEYDVSAAVGGDGTFSFALTSGSSDVARFTSSEGSAAQRPQLVVTGTGGGGGPPGGSADPENLTPPRVSPAGALRSIHHAVPGAWTGSNLSFAYRWERCDAVGEVCEPIDGAAGRRYERTTEDVGHRLRVAVTATSSSGSSVARSVLTEPLPAPPAPSADDPVVVATADIACAPTSSSFNDGQGTSTECRQGHTSDLALAIGPDAVLIPGDIQYENGEYEHFVASYDVSWGRLNGITYPAPGNHEYGTTGAAGYFGYFGTRAGNPSKGYYSFDLGSWHVISLNSNCSQAGGCGAGSPQETWLRADLAAHPTACTLAYWHHPRFSSGRYGADASVAAFWTALTDHGADLVLNGHEHHYERFAPQDGNGVADAAHGMIQIVVGMGGKSLRATRTIAANSMARNDTEYGVLELTLSEGSFSWAFRGEAGGTFIDSGTAGCVDPPSTALAADFRGAPRSDDPPLTASFLDVSRGTPVAWEWDLDGDGVVDATTANPVHTYEVAGSYDVSLTVTDAAGVRSSRTRAGYIRVPWEVQATAETDPVPHSGDSADDPAIWVHPTDPGASLVIGTDKATGGGLVTYDLDGTLVEFRADGATNNVDVRGGFSLGGASVSLVAATRESDNTIATYVVDPATLRLVDVAARPLTLTIDGYGGCLYRSPISGAMYFFADSKTGEVEQWLLFDDGTGHVEATLRRSFDVGGQVEGCVADDERAVLYVGEEDVGVWRYAAEPDGGVDRQLVDPTGEEGHLVADVEGLTIADLGGGDGYLIVSSQGDSSFVVFDRGPDNRYLGSFVIEDGPATDGVSRTDGIDIFVGHLGPGFAQGVFVAQDNTNPGANQNFKLVPAERILALFAPTPPPGP